MSIKVVAFGLCTPLLLSTLLTHSLGFNALGLNALGLNALGTATPWMTAPWTTPPAQAASMSKLASLSAAEVFPTQAVVYTSDKTGLNSYRDNLRRLRSQQQAPTKPSSSLPSSSLFDSSLPSEPRQSEPHQPPQSRPSQREPSQRDLSQRDLSQRKRFLKNKIKQQQPIFSEEATPSPSLPESFPDDAIASRRDPYALIDATRRNKLSLLETGRLNRQIGLHPIEALSVQKLKTDIQQAPLRLSGVVAKVKTKVKTTLPNVARDEPYLTTIGHMRDDLQQSILSVGRSPLRKIRDRLSQAQTAVKMTVGDWLNRLGSTANRTADHLRES